MTCMASFREVRLPFSPEPASMLLRSRAKMTVTRMVATKMIATTTEEEA